MSDRAFLSLRVWRLGIGMRWLSASRYRPACDGAPCERWVRVFWRIWWRAA